MSIESQVLENKSAALLALDRLIQLDVSGIFRQTLT